MATRKPTRTRIRKRMAARGAVRLDAYAIISEAIDAGLRYGLRRVFKYDATPVNEAALLERSETILNAIMVELGEVIVWGRED